MTDNLRAALDALKVEAEARTNRPDVAMWAGGVLHAIDRIEAALTADHATLGHQPGDPHRYKMVCSVCGEEGRVNLSLEPQYVPANPRRFRVGPSDPSWHDRGPACDGYQEHVHLRGAQQIVFATPTLTEPK